MSTDKRFSFILSAHGLQSVKTKRFSGQMNEPLKAGTKDRTAIPGQEEDAPLADHSSLLGTPVWGNLGFEKGSYINHAEQEIEYNGLTIDTVLFEITIPKTIVKTDIQGLPGSVKEYISRGDYQISIKGALVSQEKNVFPLFELNRLRQIVEVEDSVKVTSDLLHYFGIFNIVIENATFSEVEGMRNTVSFSIDAVSDEPIELIIS
jgi:hypothetical protein